jgi:hypothetical protein
LAVHGAALREESVVPGEAEPPEEWWSHEEVIPLTFHQFLPFLFVEFGLIFVL